MRLVVSRFFRAGEREFHPGAELLKANLEHIESAGVKLKHLIDMGHVVRAHAPPEPEKAKSSKRPVASFSLPDTATE